MRNTARGLGRGSRIYVKATKIRRRMRGTVSEIVMDARGPYVRFRDDATSCLFLAAVSEVKVIR